MPRPRAEILSSIVRGGCGCYCYLNPDSNTNCGPAHFISSVIIMGAGWAGWSAWQKMTIISTIFTISHHHWGKGIHSARIETPSQSHLNRWTGLVRSLYYYHLHRAFTTPRNSSQSDKKVSLVGDQIVCLFSAFISHICFVPPAVEGERACQGTGDKETQCQ